MPTNHNERPTIQLELLPEGLRARWGPSTGPWGIFREAMVPVNVEVDEWWLYVGTLKNALKPDGESDPIVSKSVATTTEMLIPRDQLPQHKVIVAQVIGYFPSEKPNGEKFKEGIYSDAITKEIK